MRCDNCGWKNLSGKKNCEKCKAPLQEEVVVQGDELSNEVAKNSYMHTVIETDKTDKGAKNLFKTLKIDG